MPTGVWEDKFQDRTENTVFMGIHCQGEMQGLMAIQTDKISRIEPVPLVYVDYLATAPWNLSQRTEEPRFRQCGTALMKMAIQHSLDLGHEGRIGLHSLSQAESFYAQKGMENLGVDVNYESLNYFEMTVKKAKIFLSNG
jgi:hypothetical protein